MTNTAQIKLGGTAKVYCIHNREKRCTTELPFDRLRQEPLVCICCENLFIRFKSDPDVEVPICNICKGG